MKDKIILFILFILSLNIAKADDDFKVSASVRKSITFSTNIDRVSTYMKNLDVYKKNFPGIVNVKKLGEKQSEWTYEIDAPLSSPMQMSFILVEKSFSDYFIIYESKNSATDYFRCAAVLEQASESSTVMTISITIRMKRESGSDVHFLAPVLGEKFISKEMRKQIEKNLSAFLNNCKKEL